MVVTEVKATGLEEAGVGLPDEVGAALLILARHGDIPGAKDAALQVLEKAGQKLYANLASGDQRVEALVGDTHGGWSVAVGGKKSPIGLG